MIRPKKPLSESINVLKLRVKSSCLQKIKSTTPEFIITALGTAQIQIYVQGNKVKNKQINL